MTAKKTPPARKSPPADPREPKGQGKTVEARPDHLATAGARRKLADLDEPDKAPSPKNDPAVTVRIPHAFRLQVLGPEGSKIVQYESGINEMPRSHATHEYSVANGVEIVAD